MMTSDEIFCEVLTHHGVANPDEQMEMMSAGASLVAIAMLHGLTSDQAGVVFQVLAEMIRNPEYRAMINAEAMEGPDMRRLRNTPIPGRPS